VLGDPASCTWLPRPATAQVAETIARLRAWTEGLEDLSWAICEAPDGPALGRVALFPAPDESPDDDGAEAAWPPPPGPILECAVMLVPPARGRGLAAEALARVTAHAFEVRGAGRLLADIDPDNHASLRLFERAGFRRIAHRSGTWTTHLGLRDSVFLILDRPPA
jgi:ribosomal-protein-alanine N-acetyltransferase